MSGIEANSSFENVKDVSAVNGIVDHQGLKDLNVVLDSQDQVDATKKIAEKLDKCDKIDLLTLVIKLPITETNKGDIQNFLDHMKHNLPSEIATTSLDADQQELKTLSDTLKNNIIAYNNSKKVAEVSKQQNIPSSQSSQLEEQMSILKENDILQFNGVIDDLQKGLLTSEKVQSFTNMMSLLRLMNGLPKDQIIGIVDEVISKQSPDKKDNPEIRFFKDTLSVVLDKGLIGNFISQVDTDLHNNERLKGISYDKLLDPTTDLSSPEAKAAINNVFNTDEELFNKFIADFKNEKKFIGPLKSKRQEIQKVHMQNIIKEYIKSDFPNEDLSGIIIQTGQVELKNSQGGSYKKDCFNIMKNDKIMEVSIGKDENGKEKHKLTPFFGDAKYGKAIPMEQCLTSNLMKDILGKNNLEMKGTADAMKKLVSVNGNPNDKSNYKPNDNPKSFSETIKGFFDNPLFKQLQEALYTLMGLIGTDEQREKAALDLNRMRSLNTIKARGESIVTRKDSGGKLMIDVIKDNDYGFKTDEVIQYKDKNGNEKSVKINTKNIFTNMTYEEQKLFLENILSGDAQKVQAAKDSMIAIHNNENPISTNTDKSKDEASEKTQENSAQGKEFKDGALYPELSIDGKSPGKVELKGKDTDTLSLIVDGQAIALVKDKESNKYIGGLCTLDADKKMYMKNITFDNDLKNITITPEEAKGINSANNKDEYVQKFYKGGKYNLDYILNNPGGGNITFLVMHSSQIFPEDGAKVKDIYDTITNKLSTKLPDVQKIFTELQRSMYDFVNKDSHNKEDLKAIINKAKDGLLAITGSESTPILQAQVDAWYNQFDFGATTNKPSTQKKPVETPVALQ